MATNENLIPIPGRLHSVATEGHVAGADEIIDDTLQKDQATLNSESAYIDNSESSSAVVPEFDPESQTVHVTAQTLSEQQKAQARANIDLNDLVKYSEQTLTTAQKDQVSQNLNNRPATNGMARIELKATDNFKSVVEAQTGGNTIFVIKYDFTLTGDVTVPANCVLEFDGGSLTSHTITAAGNLDIIGKGKITSDALPIVTSTVKNAKCNITDIIFEYTGFSSESYILNLNRLAGDITNEVGCIERCVLHCKGNCNGIDVVNSHYLSINNNIVNDCKSYGIRFIDAWGNYAINNKLSNAVSEVHAIGIYMKNSSATRIKGNLLDNRGIGILLDDAVDGISISDNGIEDLDAGIVINNGPSGVNAIGIIGNFFESCTNPILIGGVPVEGEEVPYSISIISNNIAKGGINNSEILINSGQNITFIGNRIKSNLTIASRVYKVLFSNNLIASKTILTSNYIDLDENIMNFHKGVLMLNCTTSIDGFNSEGTISMVAGTERQIKIRNSGAESGKYIVMGMDVSGNFKIQNQDEKGVIIDMVSGVVIPIT